MVLHITVGDNKHRWHALQQSNPCSIEPFSSQVDAGSISKFVEEDM
jgi:hypothetical protein